MYKIRINNKVNCFEYTKQSFFVKIKLQEKGLEKHPSLKDLFFKESTMPTGGFDFSNHFF